MIKPKQSYTQQFEKKTNPIGKAMKEGKHTQIQTNPWKQRHKASINILISTQTEKDEFKPELKLED
jgi:hypothetical protein